MYQMGLVSTANLHILKVGYSSL